MSDATPDGRPDPKTAWNDTGERLTELGRTLKERYEAQHGTDSPASKQELADAARRIGGALTDAFEVLGQAARDKSVQQDVRHAGQSLVDAVGATLGQAFDDLRQAFADQKGSGRTATEEPAGAEKPADTEKPTDAEQPAAEPPAEEKPAEEKPRIEPWGTP